MKAVILRCRAQPATGAELERAWERFREKFPQGKAINWTARRTTALRVLDWTEWGLAHPLGHEAE